MPDSLYSLVAEPEAKSPVLLMHLKGWIDAGSAAALAADSIVGQLAPVTTIVEFDDDALVDYRSRRPTMHLNDGHIDGLVWPRIEIAHGRLADADFLVLRGAEPDRHWRKFATAVVDLARMFGVTKILGIGAFPSPVPHTRPTNVVSTSTNRALIEAIGHNNTRMEVPAGVHDAIEVEAGARRMPAATLWAAVPHYVAAMDYPEGARALVSALSGLVDVDFDVSLLARAGDTNKRHIDELVAADPQHIEMLAALEAHVDQMEASRDSAVPDADELAFEIEAFLRDPDNPR